jgi:hypothetical protein
MILAATIALVLAAVDLAASVSLDPVVVAILSGTVTPGVKAIVAIVLVAVATVVNAVVATPTFTVQSIVVLFAITFASHIASYFGVWKPATGGNGAPGARATADKGIG